MTSSKTSLPKTFSKSHSKSHSENSNFDRSVTFRDLVYNIRDAVVSITCQYTLLTEHGKIFKLKHGNGFFIKNHYIVCPAHLVLINPILYHSTLNHDENTSVATVDKILVTVSNVNNKDISYSYQCEIIGIDPCGNIAILKINMVTPWNTSNPFIEDYHPFLHWGKSRGVSAGDVIAVIGDTINSDNIGFTNKSLGLQAENGVLIGNVGDNRFVYPGGQISGELLLLSNIFINGKEGLPVISMDGKVIGMTIHLQNGAVSLALSEFFMRRPIKALLNTSKYEDFVKNSLYHKGCLKVGGILMTQEDYNTDIAMEQKEIIAQESSICSKNLTCRRMNKTSSKIERVPIHDVCLGSKDIVGYRILTIADDSPLIETIHIGDIITHINDCPLGDRKGQIAPALIMWRIKINEKVKITYKMQKERFSTSRNIEVFTTEMDDLFNYPFYSDDIVYDVDILPTLI